MTERTLHKRKKKTKGGRHVERQTPRRRVGGGATFISLTDKKLHHKTHLRASEDWGGCKARSKTQTVTPAMAFPASSEKKEKGKQGYY